MNKKAIISRNKLEYIPQKRKNHLLVIAIDEYEDDQINNLNNCVRDAKALITLLKEKYLFEEENIIRLFNKDTLQKNVFDIFDSLIPKIQPDENLLICFSGHGYHHELTGEGYWVPYDGKKDDRGKYVPNAQIINWIDGIQSHHTFLIVDSCFAGSLFMDNHRNIQISKLETSPSRWCLSSGRLEVVADGIPGKNSPFMTKLLEVLRQTEEKLMVQQLCSLVTNDLINSPEVIQTPRGEPLKAKDHKGGQFVFYPRKASKKKNALHDSSFVVNSKLIDIIVEVPNPTKFIKETALTLIKKDADYERYFFSHLKHPTWLKLLRKEGYFDVVKNQLTFQFQLDYLLRISEKAKEGKFPSLINDLLEIIVHASENEKTNPRTWYYVMRILQNLPNDSIELDIFDYLPNWFATDDSLISSDVCTELLPKFLNDAPTPSDIQKAEKILTFIFSVEVLDNIISKYNSIEVKPIINLYWVRHAFIENGMVEKIARFCSDNVAYGIADSLKKAFLDFPYIQTGFDFEGKHYVLEGFLEKSDLKLVLSKCVEKDTGKDLSTTRTFAQNNYQVESEIATDRIENYEALNDTDLKSQISKFLNLKCLTSKIKDIDSVFNTIFYQLNDGYSLSWCPSIFELPKNDIYRDDVKTVFSIILREFLNYRVKVDKANTVKILTNFISAPNFRLPFFKRMALFVIAENWDGAFQSLFWKLVEQEGINNFFTNNYYYRETYLLLKGNITQFSEEEKSQIQILLDSNIGGVENLESWRLRWYSALKDDEKFQERYNVLSDKLNVSSDDFERPSGVITRWIPSESPYTEEDLLKMEVSELIGKINDFQPPPRSFEGPSIDGFGKAIEEIVKRNPYKYSEEISLFKEVSYFYIYKILFGFKEAWRNKVKFNWLEVLIFCYEYITSPSFGKEDSKLTQDRATHIWIYDVVAELISVGTYTDSEAFDANLLPWARKILFATIPIFEKNHNKEWMQSEYHHVQYNDYQVKLLHALVNYSLRVNRVHIAKGQAYKWENGIKGLINQTTDKQVLGGYIIIGRFYRNLGFLDKRWTYKKIREFYTSEYDLWLGFMMGVLAKSPIPDKNFYRLMIHHYERALAEMEKKDFPFDNKLALHLLSHCFMGYEQIGKDGLIDKFLTTINISQVQEFTLLVYRQYDYYKSLKDKKEKKRMLNVVYNLWEFILKKYENSEDKEAKEVLSRTKLFITFVDELNSENVALIIPAIKVQESRHGIYELLRELTGLLKKGESKATAGYLAQILANLSVVIYLDSKSKEHLTELVSFLYAWGYKQVANNICDAYARTRQDFLNPLYNQHND